MSPELPYSFWGPSKADSAPLSGMSHLRARRSIRFRMTQLHMIGLGLGNLSIVLTFHNRWKSGLEMLLLGGSCASIAYIIGFKLSIDHAHNKYSFQRLPSKS